MGRKQMVWGAWVLATALLLSACDARSYTVVSVSAKSTKPSAKSLDFPLAIPDSPLIAEEILDYSGPFWEDGSGSRVERVVGLMLYNPTDSMVEFGAVCLEQGGQSLYFFVHRLPPNSRCLVLEYNQSVYTSPGVETCRILSLRWAHQELCREQIDYVGLGTRLTIANRDGRTLSHVTVWYKRYVQAGDYYLGGAAFSQHLFALQSQEHRTVTPVHYRSRITRPVLLWSWKI